MQPAIHDVTDASALRSWFNPPLATSLNAELYKAQNVVRQFARVGALFPERSIPAAVLDGAAGFAVLSVVKVKTALGRICCTLADLQNIYQGLRTWILPVMHLF